MLYLSKKFRKNKNSLFFTLVFVSTSLANLKYAVFQDSSITDTFLLLIISALLVIQFLKSPKIPALKLSELGCLLFVAYLIIKNTLANTFNVSSISYWVFFIILYFGLKIFLSTKNNIANSITLLPATTIILFAYLIFAIYHCYFNKETLTNLFIPNKSVFSILLASQLAFVLPLYFNYNKEKRLLKFVSWFLFFIISASVLLLAFTQGRAGWLGLIFALFYIDYQCLSGSRIKKIVLYLIFPFFVLLTSAMFLLKSDSSNGRLLIYKISVGMLKDNWLFGIGHGQFKVKYNEYQARYFAFHSIDSKESLLADNTFYAFNDFFQALIENGLIAFLFLAALFFLVILQTINAEVSPDKKHLFTASIASLICILTGSLFSYPLQIFPIVVQATLCLSIINSFQSDRIIQFEFSETGSKITRIVLVLLSGLLFIHFCIYFHYKRESYQAFELKRSGFRQKAIEKYSNLRNSYILEGHTLYLYAQELYYTNQLIQAKETLKKAKKFYCTNEVYTLSAAIESELQNYIQAEADYKNAIYMVPNRMISRSELFQYYLRRKDTTNAIYLANSVLNMPVKVPSQKTKSIQQRTREALMQLNK